MATNASRISAASKKWWKDRGALIGKVEQWNPHVKIRQDLFGVIDYVALWGVYRSVMFIQVTSGSNHSSRVKKLHDSDAFAYMVENKIDCIMLVHSMRKNAKKRWVHRIEGWDRHTPKTAPMELQDWKPL